MTPLPCVGKSTQFQFKKNITPHESVAFIYHLWFLRLENLTCSFSPDSSLVFIVEFEVLVDMEEIGIVHIKDRLLHFCHVDLTCDQLL